MSNKDCELKFRRGAIYSNNKIGSDVLTIRILPDMVGWKKEDLPKYPMFNPTQLIKGVSEEDTKDPTKATQVWVICTDDFKIGFVMAESMEEYDTSVKKILEPYNYKQLFTHVRRQNLNTNSFDYAELKVLFNNQSFVNLYNDKGISSKGGVATATAMDVINVRTGERWYMMQSGTAISIFQNQIYLRVGSPNKKSSTISMTPNKIEIVANEISIYGRKKTALGKHGFKVCGILGAPTAVDGSPIVGFTDVTM